MIRSADVPLDRMSTGCLVFLQVDRTVVYQYTRIRCDDIVRVASLRRSGRRGSVDHGVELGVSSTGTWRRIGGPDFDSSDDSNVGEQVVAATSDRGRSAGGLFAASAVDEVGDGVDAAA